MKKILIAAIVCIVVGVTGAGVAFAQGPPDGAGAGKAPFYDSNSYTCPGGAGDTTGPTFGFVILNTNANGDLIVQVALKGSTPNATYDIWVNQNPGGCPLGAPTADDALSTNSKGNGNTHLEIQRVAGATNFWVSAVGGGQVLRSTAVTLD